MNSRISPRERGLLKGALRRIFARSELRQTVVDRTRVDYTDHNRPRVKKWSKCELCQKPTPTYLISVDHIVPVIGIDTSFEEMGLDATVERMWTDIKNLQGICDLCHDEKTAIERKQRAVKRKEKKASGRSSSKRSKKTIKTNRKRNHA